MRAWIRRVAILGLLLLLTLLGLRAWQSTQGPPLRPWHTIVPVELHADAIARGTWGDYVAAESRMFDQLHRDLQRTMTPADRTPINRYNDGGLSSPASF